MSPVKLIRPLLHSVHAVSRTATRAFADVVQRATGSDETDPNVATHEPRVVPPEAPVVPPVEKHQVAGSYKPVEMLPYPQLEQPVPIVETVLAAEQDENQTRS